jgi:CRISPR-associated protein Cmr2
MKRDNLITWKAKLAAWVHDPAEKALVLLRDNVGHEGGTVAQLRSRLFATEELKNELKALSPLVQKADQWAAAADRPQFPHEPSDAWSVVRFHQEPQLVHPLSGERYNIAGGLAEVEPAHIKAVSLDHFVDHVVSTPEQGIDWRATALSFWRFGPFLGAKEIRSVWALLPADTRVPDHTIWAHLDLSAAFATAFATGQGESPALLTMTFGPVQSFISQARSISDLWAGSHLLSFLAWQGLRKICEELGPDAVIFPQLRGIPLVDLWLRDKMGLKREWFNGLEWTKRATDANPLFSAALPNRFVVLVPASRATELAQSITATVREWVKNEGLAVVSDLLREAALDNGDQLACNEQAEKQLAEFPEVHWASVPWSLTASEKTMDTSRLAEALAIFYPDEEEKAPGFFSGTAWKVLSKSIGLDEATFYRPNPGVLYPALYDLLERTAAAAKSIRPFDGLSQCGFRCSLCGEREWLCTEREELNLSPGDRKQTLWTRVAAKKPSWARKGEHLCALCALKRLWPTRFVQRVSEAVEKGVQRYVVSTHTMALAASIDRWLKDPERKHLPMKWQAHLVGHERVALPALLSDKLIKTGDEQAKLFARCLPSLLDQLREDARSEDSAQRQQAGEILESLQKDLKGIFHHKPEAYYALVMMDGDRMGAWLAGSDDRYSIRYWDSWHERIQEQVNRIAGRKPQITQYLDAMRPPSPARHMAISGALNGFALDLARHALEALHNGKLIYSGGDDVLAMVPVDGLLSVMFLLRLLYSGLSAGSEPDRDLLFGEEGKNLRIGKGHTLLKGRLYRSMGCKATASAGAVIAHHTAPLGMVLRTLRRTESRAKDKGCRDAFAVTILKRSGGAVDLTCPWFPAGSIQRESLLSSPVGLLVRLRNAFAGKGALSRRAAYIIQDWAERLPGPALFKDLADYEDMLSKNLAFQFSRQSGPEKKESNALLGAELASLAVKAWKRSGRDSAAAFVIDLLAVAEFLAREGRAGATAPGGVNGGVA